jgi:hypothetical protein
MHHSMEPSLSQDVILPHGLLHGVTTNDMRGSMQLFYKEQHMFMF